MPKCALTNYLTMSKAGEVHLRLPALVDELTNVIDDFELTVVDEKRNGRGASLWIACRKIDLVFIIQSCVAAYEDREHLHGRERIRIYKVRDFVLNVARQICESHDHIDIIETLDPITRSTIELEARVAQMKIDLP